MRLLLILRRLTDIQSELVLYWKISAGSGGLWDKNWRGKEKKKKGLRFKVNCHLAFFSVFYWGAGGKNKILTDSITWRSMLRLLFLQHLHPGLFSNPHAVAERRNCIKRWMFGHTGLFFMRRRVYVYLITVLTEVCFLKPSKPFMT